MIKVTTISISVVIAVIILFMIGKYAINEHVLPSPAEFVASTTYQTDLLSIEPTQDTIQNHATTSIKTPIGNIFAYISTSTIDQERGLGMYTSLNASSSMLFIFPTEETRGFWMKDMLFPIDIVWFDANKKIISVDEDVSPKTYPKIFMSSAPVKYVLELNSKKAKYFGLETGKYISF